MAVPRLQHYLVAVALLQQGATLDQCEGGCQERVTTPSLMQKLSMHDPSFAAVAEEGTVPDNFAMADEEIDEEILPEMAIEAQAKAQLQAAGQSSAQVRTAAPQHATPKEKVGKGDDNFDGNNHADEDDIKEDLLDNAVQEEQDGEEQAEQEEEDEEQEEKGSDENDNANNDEEEVTQDSNNDEEADAETSPVDDGKQIMMGDKVHNRGKSNLADHQTTVLSSKSINKEENSNSQNYHNENENNLDDHNAGSNNDERSEPEPDYSHVQNNAAEFNNAEEDLNMPSMDPNMYFNAEESNNAADVASNNLENYGEENNDADSGDADNPREDISDEAGEEASHSVNALAQTSLARKQEAIQKAKATKMAEKKNTASAVEAPRRQKQVNKAVQKIKKATDKQSFDIDNHNVEAGNEDNISSHVEQTKEVHDDTKQGSVEERPALGDGKNKAPKVKKFRMVKEAAEKHSTAPCRKKGGCPDDLGN